MNCIHPAVYRSCICYASLNEAADALYSLSETGEITLISRKAAYNLNIVDNQVYFTNGLSAYYDILVELNVKTFSVSEGKTIWDKNGFWCTNYCSNNFVDCMRFGLGEVDAEGNSRDADCHIKQEYSAEQLLAFYQQGLDLQNRLIELYQRLSPE